ncbi:MAG TPA: hypothetical protein PLY80_18700 [Pseudomonadota bacterium]|nr:hypothetical protein [Pseudomonadota bacterium]
MSRTRSAFGFDIAAVTFASFLLGATAQAQTAQKVDAADLIAAQKAGGPAAAAYNGKLLEVFNLKINGFFPVNDALMRRNPALDLRTSKYFDYIACESTLANSPELAKLATGQQLVVTGVAQVGTYSLRLSGCTIVKLLDPVLPPSVSMADTGGKVTAADVVTDYLRNSVAATLKYKGKVIAISGKLSDTSGGKLKLRGTEFNSVTCSVPGPVATFAASLPSGSSVVVKGTVSEMDTMDLQVKDCSLVDPVQPPPAAAPVAAQAAPVAAPTAPVAAPTAPVAAPTAPVAAQAAPAAAVKFKAADLKSYYPTAVHAGGNWTMTGVAAGIPVQVRMDEKDGSPTRGHFFITIAGGTERPMNKTELRMFYDGMLARAKAPGAAPFEKEAARALAQALGIKPPKLP